MSDLLTGSICLSDIPKELIKESKGKKYLNINIRTLSSMTSWGATHMITYYVRKDMRDKFPKNILGNLKPYDNNDSDVTTASIEQDDDLPF